MELSAAEITGLIGGTAVALKIIDKLVDGLLHKYQEKKNANGRGPLAHNGYSLNEMLWKAATAMESSAQTIKRLCELQAETSNEVKATRDEMRSGCLNLGQRIDALLHRRSDDR